MFAYWSVSGGSKATTPPIRQIFEGLVLCVDVCGEIQIDSHEANTSSSSISLFFGGGRRFMGKGHVEGRGERGGGGGGVLSECSWRRISIFPQVSYVLRDKRGYTVVVTEVCGGLHEGSNVPHFRSLTRRTRLERVGLGISYVTNGTAPACGPVTPRRHIHGLSGEGCPLSKT